MTIGVRELVKCNRPNSPSYPLVNIVHDFVRTIVVLVTDARVGQATVIMFELAQPKGVDIKVLYVLSLMAKGTEVVPFLRG